MDDFRFKRLGDPEPDHSRVIIPTNEDEAVMMVLVGTQWLKEHAPHRLKPAPPDDAP